MSGKTIAVVDDEPFIVDMITTYFEIKGYTVRGVYTGQEGLILAEVEQPDLLLLDLMLPDLHGYEVARALRAKPQFATLPIVIISARVEAEARKLAEEAGANAYLVKPLKMADVLVEVQKWLAAPPAPAPEASAPAPEASAPAPEAPAATEAAPPAAATSTPEASKPAEAAPPVPAASAPEASKPADAAPPAPTAPAPEAPKAAEAAPPAPTAPEAPAATDAVPPAAATSTPEAPKPADPAPPASVTPPPTDPQNS